MDLEAIKARTAARKAAGLIPKYAHPPAPIPQPASARVPLGLAPCIHLGERLTGQPCGSQLLRCKLHGDITTRFMVCKEAQRCCVTCPDRTLEPPPPQPVDTNVSGEVLTDTS
jgi:hypothetical protein